MCLDDCSRPPVVECVREGENVSVVECDCEDVGGSEDGMFVDNEVDVVLEACILPNVVSKGEEDMVNCKPVDE